jgi:lipopolysaccharide/colanic/teichoic acid biosynthesis glycosyltransferase
VRRGFDILFVVLMLPVALPLIAISSVAIILESPGSPFFIQERIGKDGRPFRIWKLRTMVPDAASKGAGLYFEANDPRLLRVGARLRQLSLDELPQLLNVARGDMAVVGPRPPHPDIYVKHMAEYRRILRVRPGLTGPVQVAGRNELPRSLRLKIESEYASRRSLATDLLILLRTPLVVARGDGVSMTQGHGDVER